MLWGLGTAPTEYLDLLMALDGQVNLSVGAYRTEEGKPWILPSVAEAEKMVRTLRCQHLQWEMS